MHEIPNTIVYNGLLSREEMKKIFQGNKPRELKIVINAMINEVHTDDRNDYGLSKLPETTIRFIPIKLEIEELNIKIEQ